MTGAERGIVCPRCQRPCSQHHPCEQPQCTWVQCDHCRVIVDPVRRRYFAHQKATGRP